MVSQYSNNNNKVNAFAKAAARENVIEIISLLR